MDNHSFTALRDALNTAGLPRRRALARFLAASLALGLASSVKPHDAVARKKHKKNKKGKHKKKRGGEPEPEPQSEEEVLLGLINDYRTANDAGPLTRQNQLDAAAQVHAEDMATHDYVGFTLSNGQSWNQNIEASGYDGAEPWGVLLATGVDTAAGAFQLWRNDSIRNAVMLQPLYEEIGVRRVESSTATYDWYWVTTLGAG